MPAPNTVDPHDTLVIDLKRHNPSAFGRFQHECAELPLMPGWRSSHDAYLRSAGIGWHWNHNLKAPRGIAAGPNLPPPPGSTQARQTVTHYLKGDSYRAWHYIWQLLRNAVQLPNLELVRVYLNAYPYGTDTGVHTDSAHPDEVTIVLAVHEDWHPDYGGETAVLDANDEVARAVLPVPGRAFLFRAGVRHAARPLARSCGIVRRMAVFKCGSWPVDMPIRSRAPDDIERPFVPQEPFAHAHALTGPTRLAAAATWLSRTPAASWPHGRTNFASHLTTTALYLQALGADDTTVLAGLAHAVFGTQAYRRILLDPIRDRALAESVFGADATALALRFASVNRKALASWGERLLAGAPPPPDGIRIERHAHAPEPGDPVHLETVEHLEQLLLIESANLLTMTADPTQNTITEHVAAAIPPGPSAAAAD